MKSIASKLRTMASGVYQNGLRIAVVGCGHGELDKFYNTIEHASQKNRYKVDLLLICGDFQAIRNETDFAAMSVKPKYRHMRDFHQYYSGAKTAPILTIFIGGNHESSSHLYELFHGGWVAPNMYYLGASGVIRVGGLRIGGLSGIFKEHNYKKRRYERLPFTSGMLTSTYHVREYDQLKLEQIKEPMDVMVSHDWPRGIEAHGNYKHMGDFRVDLARDSVQDPRHETKLGSPAAWSILEKTRPRYWFGAHYHYRFPAIVDADVDNVAAQAQKDTYLRTKLGIKVRKVDQPRVPQQAQGDYAQADVERPSEPVVVVNEDQIDLESDLDDIGGPSEPVVVVNEDQIDLDSDLDDVGGPSGGVPLEAEPALNPVPAPLAAIENPDEIGLDSETEDVPPAVEAEPVQAHEEVTSNEEPSPTTAEQEPVLNPAVSPSSEGSKNRYTRFLALGKCDGKPNETPITYDDDSGDSHISQQSGRQYSMFLQITTIDFPTTPLPAGISRTTVSYDPEWLSIVRAFNHYPAKKYVTSSSSLDGPSLLSVLPRIPSEIAQHRKWIDENIVAQGKLEVPRNFEISAPVQGREEKMVDSFPQLYRNNQVKDFCDLLEMDNWVWWTDDEIRFAGAPGKRQKVPSEGRVWKPMAEGQTSHFGGGGRGRGGGRGGGRGRGGRGGGGGGGRGRGRK